MLQARLGRPSSLVALLCATAALAPAGADAEPGGHGIYGPLVDESLALNPNGEAPLSAEEEIEHARRACDAGDLEGAIASYARALALDPRSTKALSGRAWALRRLGRRDESDADYLRAIALHTATIEREPLQAQHWEDRGLARHAIGQLDAALSDFLRAVELQPDNARAWSAIGMVYLDRAGSTPDRDRQRADYERAIDPIARALTLANLHPEGWNNLGKAYLELGNLAERGSAAQAEHYRHALEALDEAIRQRPGYDLSLNNRGLVRYQMADVSQDTAGRAELFAQAVSDLMAACEANGLYYAPHVNLGAALLNIAVVDWGPVEPPIARPAALDMAIDALEHATQVEPGRDTAFYNLGRCCMERVADLRLAGAPIEERRDTLERARQAFASAARIAPESATYAYQLMVVLAHQGDVDEALGSARRLYELQGRPIPPDWELLLTIAGEVKGRSDRWPDEALPFLQASLRLEPNQPNAATIRGILGRP